MHSFDANIVTILWEERVHTIRFTVSLFVYMNQRMCVCRCVCVYVCMCVWVYICVCVCVLGYVVHLT
jgi:hypothetical protein